MHAYIVADLGFGDSGKGLLTDYLVRELGAGLVVRYNGGAQAGHNVIAPDGLHHTFTQFGSGSFVHGVLTYLSRYVTFHPTALLAEGYILQQKGLRDIFDRLRVSDQALVITPFHQAINRLRELSRADNRHGSCGVGVGETVEDALLNPANCILAGELKDSTLLEKKLNIVREIKREQINELFAHLNSDPAVLEALTIFEDERIIENWISAIAPINELGLVVSDKHLGNWLKQIDTVIFEGAQGVLLDANWGFHPYTTWSNCTMDNAFAIIDDFAPGSSVCRMGVMRNHVVRHGPGPLPTETDALTNLIFDHNQHNSWQGAVRYGWFDSVLVRYALHVIGGVDRIMLTHMDLLKHLKEWRYCIGYERDTSVEGVLNKLISFKQRSNHEPARFSFSNEVHEDVTRALFKVRPILKNCIAEGNEVLRNIESLIEHSIDIVSQGPCSKDVLPINQVAI